jgi:methionyl-tRNA synthetase
VTVSKGDAIFPRIDAKKELEELDRLQAAAKAEVKAEVPPVTIEEFSKVKLQACKVISCENVPKSEKLLKFILDDGSGKERQILSGIAKYYRPEELVGKTVLACTNLPPRKMMGQESSGMIISAVSGDDLKLVMLDDGIPAGAELC